MLRDVETTVKLVLALAPGFVALALLELIADLGELNEFRILFYGLALTFVCWVIVLAFLGIGRIFFKRLPVEPSNHPALLVIVFLVAATAAATLIWQLSATCFTWCSDRCRAPQP